MTAEASSSETTFERLLSMDIIRGIAIIGVLFVHPLLFGVWRSAANAIAVVPNYVVFIFLPLIFLMSWGGGFTFISGIVNTYVFYKRLKQGVSFKKAAIPIFLNNTFLLLVTPLKLYFFERLIYSYYEPDKLITSVFVYLFREGQLHWPHHERMFRPLILPSIALAGYFSIFLFWVLFRNNGFLKIKRNIIILCVLAVILFATSNVIVDALSPYVELWYFKEGIFTAMSFFLLLFVGNHLSFFPVGLFVILGIIGGYLIALYKEEKISYKIIQYFGFGFGFTFLIAFVIHIIIDVILAADPIPALIAIFDYQFYPRELLFFAVGSMCLLFLLFIKKLEFIPAEMKTKLKQRTKLIRDFGKVTLTLYIMEAFINGGLAVGFHAIFGDITVPYGEIDAFMTNPWAIILFVLTFSLFWVAFVYFWSKIDFKYGFEHFNNLLTKNLRSVNSLRSFNNQSSDEASSMQKNPD